ncbi:hypothetical protein [Streptomyces sp. NPDC046727]|uniref:hypothetical protein n=1 Tax=Streptomyces sp. NPDC046727 TaxID=3155373 RepID=UPI0033F7FAF9
MDGFTAKSAFEHGRIATGFSLGAEQLQGFQVDGQGLGVGVFLAAAPRSLEGLAQAMEANGPSRAIHGAPVLGQEHLGLVQDGSRLCAIATADEAIAEGDHGRGQVADEQ